MKKEEDYGEGNVDVFDFASKLSDVCRTTPKISFNIKYTGTDGNKRIHKEFLEYAYDFANNEYLVAIGKLLDAKKLLEKFLDLEDELRFLSERIRVLENGEKEDGNKDSKSGDELPKSF